MKKLFLILLPLLLSGCWASGSGYYKKEPERKSFKIYERGSIVPKYEVRYDRLTDSYKVYPAGKPLLPAYTIKRGE